MFTNPLMSVRYATLLRSLYDEILETTLAYAGQLFYGIVT